MMDGTYFDEHGNKFILRNDRWIVECCDEPRGLVGGICDFCGGEVQPDPEVVLIYKQPTKQNE